MISDDEQLAALQARIEDLHATKLPTDEELFALEDLIADYVELTASVADGIITKDMIYSMPTVAVASKLDKLVILSAAMAGDAAFGELQRMNEGRVLLLACCRDTTQYIAMTLTL